MIPKSDSGAAQPDQRRPMPVVSILVYNDAQTDMTWESYVVDAVRFRQYIQDIQANLELGNSTEHTHRPALKTLLESAGAGITATNEPSRIECGAPDFSVARGRAPGQITLGYVEAKNVDLELEPIERDSDRTSPATVNGAQLRRYRKALPNLILTNYTEFRWYADGELRMTAELALRSGDSVSARNGGIERTDELMNAFLDRAPEPVASPADLARRMARITHMIRDVVQSSVARRRASQDVNDLYEAARERLVPSLTLNDFADMFAQTLAYGLFAARVNNESGVFHRRDAIYDIPAANPFLRQIFNLIAGPNAENEPFIGFVDDLAQLLAGADMEAILADFGSRDVRQDPIMHFYETFLAAYDPELRERRGVYYTPEPVISYIVRSVDHILKERFGCADGLADHRTADYEAEEWVDGEVKRVTKRAHRVIALDPACGTGSFLYAVIDHIRQSYRDRGRAGMWDGYVQEHLLKRIFGFELMMAPYAMAHLKLGMQLAAQDMPEYERSDWSYRFGENERLGVYLNNSLEQAERQTATMFGPMRVLTEEANAASEIKRDLPIMVVLGNPPYSGHSANASRRGGRLTWIGELIEDYKEVDGKPLGERNPKWLQDDYVKFIRFGQWRIQQSGAGVLAFITNNGYLDNPTFRGMRQQLMDTFTDIYLLDLHGNAKKRERSPGGGADENVFDIQQGVSIAIFVKEPDKRGPAEVRHADLWGERAAKYAELEALDVSTTDWEQLEPASPNYLFKPWDNALDAEYRQWPSVNEVMPVNSVGVVTARDRLTIRWSRDEVMNVVRDFAALDPEEARSRFNLPRDVQDWKVHLAQADLRKSGIREDMATPVLYRPFDTRYTYYTGTSRGFICRPRSEVMRHMLDVSNNGLCIGRAGQVTGSDIWDVMLISKYPTDFNLFRRGGNNLYPLYIYPSEQEIAQGLYALGDRQPNLSPEFTSNLEQRLGLRFVSDGNGDLKETFGPQDALHYIYAVFHSPAFRERYDQFLRADFPHVPIPRSVEIFRSLAELGQRLTDAHLMTSTEPSSSPVSFPVTGDNIVEKAHPKYYAPGQKPPGCKSPIESGRVYISKNNCESGKSGQYFEGIEPDVWEFRIGGYQPMDKWLKDRKGRTLTFDDQERYVGIADALRETIRIMDQVDVAIAEGGGPVVVGISGVSRWFALKTHGPTCPRVLKAVSKQNRFGSN